MKRALIGHTGFVGSNLLRQQSFDDCYNSKNIGDIAGKTYDEVICAGARAEKWKANQDPASDALGINQLVYHIKSAHIARLILISTVDVHLDCSYGIHRRWLERMLQPQLTLRLPGLFGYGLKKNFLYDLLHTGESKWTHKDSTFQFFDVGDIPKQLWEQETVTLVSPPLEASEIAKEVFGIEFTNTNAPIVNYDYRDYRSLFGYTVRKEYILERMKEWVNRETSPL